MQIPQKAVEVAGPLSVTWSWRMWDESSFPLESVIYYARWGLHEQLVRSGDWVFCYFKSGEKTYTLLIWKIKGLYALVIIKAEMQSVY